MEAALRLERPDRPPAGAWGHTFVEEWSPQALADVTIGRAKRFGWDFIKFQPRASCFAEAFGAEYKPSGSPTEAPVEVRRVVQEFSDWSFVPAVDGSAKPLADQVDALGIVAHELPEIPVIQTVFSPLTVAGYLVGKDPQKAVAQLFERPEVVGPALGRIADTLVDFANRSVDAGAAGIFYAVSGYASADLVKSRADYEELVLPYDISVLSRLPSAAWFNVLHLCGPRIHFGIAGQLPAQAISWSVHEAGNPSLKLGRAEAGQAVMGGLAQDTTLLSGSPDDVVREAERAISDTDGRGFVLAPGCSVPPEAPEQNLAAITRAVAVQTAS